MALNVLIADHMQQILEKLPQLFHQILLQHRLDPLYQVSAHLQVQRLYFGFDYAHELTQVVLPAAAVFLEQVLQLFVHELARRFYHLFRVVYAPYQLLEDTVEEPH